MRPTMAAAGAAVRAFAAGCRDAARSPGLLVFVAAMTLLSAVPFGLVLASRLQNALVHQPPISLAAEEIDAEWWMDFRADATGLERTFTPAVIGFAAPLDNFSALLDGTPRPPVLIVPVLLYLAVWAFLWGGVINRYAHRRTTARQFLAAATRHVAQMAVIGLAASAAALLLYATVHAALFGFLFPALAASLPGEREAFFVRLGFYVAFGLLLAVLSLIADYTRVHAVSGHPRSVLTAASAAAAFIRSRWAAVLLLYALTAACAVGLFVIYGLADRRLGGWRAVFAAQTFILGRLALRLVSAASQVALVRHYGEPLTRRGEAAEALAVSRAPGNDGPPAAT